MRYLLTILVLALPTPALAAPIAGHWSGAMVEKGQALSVSFDFGDSGGRFTSPSQRAMDYPLDEVHTKADTIGFTLGGGIVFEGRLGRDTVSGTFKDGNGGGTFTLARAAEPVLPYDAQDVSFRNGGVELKGTLCLPRGPGRHGAVVLVHGSGPETRWGTNRYIADRLARAGIAALIYDKRGSGASGGDWRTASFEDLARDALAGIDLLDARSDIDPARIGIHGHSQGGAIGPLAATLAPDKIAFVVAEDTFAGTQYAQDIYRVRQAIKELELPAADEAKAMEIYGLFVDASRGARTYEAFEKASAPYRETAWYKWMEFPPRDSWVWAWAAKTANFDTLPVWRKVRVPVLLIYGEKDALVPPDESIAGIGSELARSGTPYAAFIVPSAVHNLTIQPDPKEPFFWWHQAPGVVDTVVDWIGARAGRSSMAAEH
jgi:pimeloyl-ACP methyl ester carboxylesterase